MDRRSFLNATALIGASSMLGYYPALSKNIPMKVDLPQMSLKWYPMKTTRPFAIDVDHNNNLWFGSAERFFHLDTVTMKCEEHPIDYLEGKPVSTSLCQEDKVYILAQKSPYLYVYHTQNKNYTKHLMPDPESNIWFGLRVPDDSRLYLFVRNRNKLLIWDSEKETGKEVAYPDAMDLWSGFYIPGDDAIYSFTLDSKPARLVRFDLQLQKFDVPIMAPEPDLEITGVNPIGNVVYCADRFTGRIFPYDFVRRAWAKPIQLPGHGTIYGFVGMGTTYNGLALYCISSYKGSMKWDFSTNTYLSKGDENIGVDGRPHHFLNKYLVFDPRSGETGFLEAPEIIGKQYPLICYSFVHNNQLFITGYDLGDVYTNPSPMGERQGNLCVFHSI